MPSPTPCIHLSLNFPSCLILFDSNFGMFILSTEWLLSDVYILC
uniref:Uncharacterized protein n=1 Tax=Rhizophora mucronata TaxID=61149 RepID=A0A2P2PJI0_RHIMU